MSLQLITLDFETYYGNDFTLSKLTTEAYVRDPRFQTIGVGVKVGSGPSVWMEDAAFRAWAARVDWSRCAVLCHHTHFDGLILEHHYGIRPGFWFDTLSMSRALHPETGGSLAKLMVAYGVGEKGHEVELAKNKRREDFTPADWLQYGVYCCGDVEGTLAIFQQMIARENPRRLSDEELWLIDTTIRMYTEPTFVGDEPKLSAFLAEERARKKTLLARLAALPPDTSEEAVLDAVRARLNSNPKFAALLIELGEDPPRKISPRTGEEAYAFAKSDPGMQALLEHPRDEIRWVAEARVAVKSTINETRTERFLSCASRGAMPVYLKYCGAHTDRWSGGDGMNMQNLVRGGVLRDSLTAPEDWVIVVADSGAIEARMTAWLAGHTTLVEAFAKNLDIYSAFAAEVYQRPVNRKLKLADGTEPDEVPGRVGKISILGLGYSMGFMKFAATLASAGIVFSEQDAQAMGLSDFLEWFRSNDKRRARVEEAPSRMPLAARLVHFAVAESIVNKYRKTHSPIVELWDTMNDVLGCMDDADANAVFGPGDCLRVVRHAIIRPNGRALRYPGLENRAEDNGRPSYSYMGGHASKERVRAYGGSMTENLVQALARDVVAEQMLNLRRKYGYHVATMSHDEVVLMVPKAEGERALERAIAEMRTPPSWAPGLPLNAEGGIGATYGEAK